MKQVSFAPGAVAAGTNIDLPAGSDPIGVIYNATLFRGSDGTAAAAEVTVTATKVDRDTIKLDVATLTRDLLVLRYEAEFERLRP
jgi:hypothetical protein